MQIKDQAKDSLKFRIEKLVFKVKSSQQMNLIVACLIILSVDTILGSCNSALTEISYEIFVLIL